LQANCITLGCAEKQLYKQKLKDAINYKWGRENAFKQIEGRQNQCFDGNIHQLFHY